MPSSIRILAASAAAALALSLAACGTDDDHATPVRGATQVIGYGPSEDGLLNACFTPGDDLTLYAPSSGTAEVDGSALVIHAGNRTAVLNGRVQITEPVTGKVKAGQKVGRLVFAPNAEGMALTRSICLQVFEGDEPIPVAPWLAVSA